MSISRACYVRCDWCGNPAEITTTGGAAEARAIAKRAGWKRLHGKDICPAHISWRRTDGGQWLWHLDANLTPDEAYAQHIARTSDEATR